MCLNSRSSLLRLDSNAYIDLADLANLSLCSRLLIFVAIFVGEDVAKDVPKLMQRRRRRQNPNYAVSSDTAKEAPRKSCHTSRFPGSSGARAKSNMAENVFHWFSGTASQELGAL